MTPQQHAVALAAAQSLKNHESQILNNLARAYLDYSEKMAETDTEIAAEQVRADIAELKAAVQKLKEQRDAAVNALTEAADKLQRAAEALHG